MVRKIHISLNRKSKETESGLHVTQAGMVCTQFLYIGLQLSPYFGIINHASEEDLENLNHHVRAIGFMLGIKDEFNLCGETIKDTAQRVESIKEDFFKPNMADPTPEYLSYMKIAVAGMWYFDPTLHYDKLMFQIKRTLQVPGYYYFESEKQECDDENSNMKILEQYSFYTRFTIFLDVVILEYLTNFAVFRYMFILFRMSFSLLEVFPILLTISFGKQFAMAEKRRKKKL